MELLRKPAQGGGVTSHDGCKTYVDLIVGDLSEIEIGHSQVVDLFRAFALHKQGDANFGYAEINHDSRLRDALSKSPAGAQFYNILLQKIPLITISDDILGNFNNTSHVKLFLLSELGPAPPPSPSPTAPIPMTRWRRLTGQPPNSTCRAPRRMPRCGSTPTCSTGSRRRGAAIRRGSTRFCAVIGGRTRADFYGAAHPRPCTTPARATMAANPPAGASPDTHAGTPAPGLACPGASAQAHCATASMS